MKVLHAEEINAAVQPLTKHPAKYSSPILAVFERLIRDERGARGPLRVFDPFAGVGRIHTLARDDVTTLGMEIEPEWAACHGRTLRGDSLTFMADCARQRTSFDLVITSPCYGNRFADHHNARDESVRRSYRHDLGRMPTEGSSATLHWGPAYKAFHAKAYSLIYGVVRPPGLFVLNVSDFVRKGQRVHAVAWHEGAAWGAGFTLERHVQVATPRMRHGQNHAARVETESVLVFRRQLR